MAVAAVVMASCSKESAPSGSSGAQPMSSAEATVDPSAASLELVQIHWSSANPSLGPYDRTSRAAVGPGDFESPQAWSAAIATLLDETRVNGVATLREYLVAKRDQHAARVAGIEGADARNLGEGGGHASVSFVIDGGVSISIDNLQRTRLSGHWERFWELHLRDAIEVEEPPTPKVAPAASPQAASAGPPSPQRAWHLAARVEVDEGDDPARLRLFTSADGTLFVTSGPLVMRVGTDGAFAPDRAWLRGLEPPGGDSKDFEGIAAWDVETLGGRLPDGLYLSLRTEIDGRADPPTQQVYRWADTAWTPIDHAATRFTWQLTGLAPWRDGSVLALRSFTLTMPPDVDMVSVEYEAEFHEIVARQRRLVVLRGRPKAPAQLAKERILAFAARETGELVAIVHVPPKDVSAYEAETALRRSYAILHYAPDRPLQRVSRPELTEALVQWNTPAVAFGGDGVLRAWGSIETTKPGTFERTHAPLLLRYDGERWIREEPPPCRDETSIVAFATDVGRQWAGCKGHASEPGAVLTRAAEGPWEPELMPDDALRGGATIDIVVRGPDDVWIAGGAVYRTQPVRAPVVLPGLAAQWAAR